MPLLTKRDRFVYSRTLGDKKFIVDCNLGSREQKAYKLSGDYKLLFGSCGRTDPAVLKPYEARIWVTNGMC